jgi:type IV pilus assembly protein PilA
VISHTLQRKTRTVPCEVNRTSTRLWARAADSSGFTLPELLVVMLIIGILAAIAIPSFLSTTGNAVNAQAKTLAQSAQTTAETIGTENSGNYANVTEAELHRIEPTIVTKATVTAPKSEAYVSAATPGSTEYTITVTASNGNEFTIAKGSTGAVTRTCTSPKGKASCSW